MTMTRWWIQLAAVLVVLAYESAASSAQPAEAPPAPASSAPVGDDELPLGAHTPAITEEGKPWSTGVSSENRTAARDLFLEGNRLFRIPLFAQAARRYAAAVQRWKHPAFYFNLALAQLNLGQDAEAHESLERALEHGPEPLGEGQYREAQHQLEELNRRLGRIRVTCQTPGAEVTLDGALLFVAPGSYEGWTTAKSHELTAKKSGFLSEARTVEVSPASSQDLELRLLTLNQASDASRRWAIWKPWLVAGAGAAVIAAGGTLHALAAHDFNKYDRDFLALECAADHMPSGCNSTEIGPERAHRLKRAGIEQSVAIGAYAVGGVIALTGFALLYMNRPQMSEYDLSRVMASSPRIQPVVSGTMLGISIDLRHL